jgi:succinate dehydrogenase / fumarate reductase iron-sulfur subunit
MLKIKIQRFDKNAKPQSWMQEYTLSNSPDRLLQALQILKTQDTTLSFRSSCQEGVCGSDAMNVNGKNLLACITKVKDLGNEITIRPMPGLPVLRDLIVDMEPFYAAYKKIKPYLVKNSKNPKKENLQSPKERKKLDGLYECIMCGACTTSCPSYWWNPEKFLGPQALLKVNRFLVDSRDENTKERLNQLDDANSVYKCRTIMSCVDACPKKLNPTKAISNIKKELI